MPERDYGPPEGLKRTELMRWATRQIHTATCEGEIRAAMRVLMANDPDGPRRAFIRSVRQRLLQVGATPPHASP